MKATHWYGYIFQLWICCFVFEKFVVILNLTGLSIPVHQKNLQETRGGDIVHKQTIQKKLAFALPHQAYKFKENLKTQTYFTLNLKIKTKLLVIWQPINKNKWSSKKLKLLLIAYLIVMAVFQFFKITLTR